MSYKMLYHVLTNVYCFTLCYLVSFKSMFKPRTGTVVIYPACKSDCVDGEIEYPYQHHGALYSDIFRTILFGFSLAIQYTLSPTDIR